MGARDGRGAESRVRFAETVGVDQTLKVGMWKDLLLKMVKQDSDEYETDSRQRQIHLDFARVVL